MNTNNLIRSINVVLLATGLTLSSLSLAGPGHEDSGHGHGDSKSGHMMSGSDKGHMMSESNMNKQGMNEHMREVMGEGQINKVMADKGMVNIKHEPIPEMKWPKMRMNFKTQDQVNLTDLQPGQKVSFTLLVDDDNNYVIKEITVK